MSENGLWSRDDVATTEDIRFPVWIGPFTVEGRTAVGLGFALVQSCSTILVRFESIDEPVNTDQIASVVRKHLPDLLSEVRKEAARGQTEMISDDPLDMIRHEGPLTAFWFDESDRKPRLSIEEMKRRALEQTARTSRNLYYTLTRRGD